MKAKIQISSDTYLIKGVSAKAMRAGFEALVAAEERGRDVKKPTVVASILEVEYQALGYEVEIVVAPGHLLQHSCGTTYTPAQWFAVPYFEQPVIASNGGDAVLEMRNCRCCSTVSLGSMDLVPAVSA